MSSYLPRIFSYADGSLPDSTSTHTAVESRPVYRDIVAPTRGDNGSPACLRWQRLVAATMLRGAYEHALTCTGRSRKRGPCALCEQDEAWMANENLPTPWNLMTVSWLLGVDAGGLRKAYHASRSAAKARGYARLPGGPDGLLPVLAVAMDNPWPVKRRRAA